MVQGLVQYPGQGCVVEFMQGNAPQIAWVLEEQHGKLRLLLPNRRETLLAVNRILPWAGPVYAITSSKDEAIARLEEHKSRRAETEVGINPVEIWELAQGEVTKAAPLWLTELAIADPSVDDMAACGHVLLGSKTHFRFQPPDFEVFPAEKVEARLAEQEANRRRDAIVNGGAEFFHQLWERHKTASAKDLHEPDAEIAEHLRSMLLQRIADPETQEEASLWQNLVRGLPDDPFLALYLAQAWKLVGPHYNFWLDRIGYTANDTWSAAFQDEIDAIVQQIRTGDADAPSCTLPFISIDAAITRDIDDAFFVESLPDGGWRLVLALACPVKYWNFESDLDLAVRQRASSLYLPEKTCHMLPEMLGTNGCSLLQEKTRPAFLVQCEIAPDGTIRSTVPSSGTARLAANLTYEQCESVLAGQPDADNPALPFAEMLHCAAALADAHLAVRLNNGAVIIKRPELLIHLEGEGEDIKVSLDLDESAPTAHQLVAELMILVNAGLAAWADARQIPLLYRTQDVVIPPEYRGIWTEPEDISRVARALAPAILEITPRPHAGLGVKAYAPSSSPLRRYSDFLNEAQILHAVQYGSPEWQESALNALRTIVSMRMDAVSQVQRAWPRYWKLLYFLQAGEHWWSAVVTDENAMMVTLNLPREQLIVRAKRAMLSERAHIGQQVEVRLTKIRPLHNDFQLAEVRE